MLAPLQVYKLGSMKQERNLHRMKLSTHTIDYSSNLTFNWHWREYREEESNLTSHQIKLTQYIIHQISIWPSCLPPTKKDHPRDHGYLIWICRQAVVIPKHFAAKMKMSQKIVAWSGGRGGGSVFLRARNYSPLSVPALLSPHSYKHNDVILCVFSLTDPRKPLCGIAYKSLSVLYWQDLFCLGLSYFSSLASCVLFLTQICGNLVRAGNLDCPDGNNMHN